jgi:hypothetical protein
MDDGDHARIEEGFGKRSVARGFGAQVAGGLRAETLFLSRSCVGAPFDGALVQVRFHEMTSPFEPHQPWFNF